MHLLSPFSLNLLFYEHKKTSLVSEYDQEIASFIKLPCLSWDPDFSGQMDK